LIVSIPPEKSVMWGVEHDRDLNAALKIRSEGLKVIPLAAGLADPM